MADDKKKQELRSFEWKSVQGAPQIYSNYFHVGWSLDDVRITFGTLQSENVSTKNYYAEERGSAIFSWRQAKNLRDALNRVLRDYEAKNGEITIPTLAEDTSAKKKVQ